MNKTISILAMLGVIGFAAPVAQAADDASPLVQKGGCLACHTVDKKVLGPSYKDVAAKYKGQADAEALLIKRVKDGSSGIWGPIPMPPNGTKLSDAEYKTVVTWILAQ